MSWWLWVLVSWPVASVGVALVVGRALRVAEARRTSPVSAGARRVLRREVSGR